MKQIFMSAPGKIESRDVPIPPVGGADVLLKVKRIGVCGSDIHVFHGKHPYTSYPVVQGHEVSGEIAQVGADVRGFAVGQNATFMPQVWCGNCYPCTHGRYNICNELKVMGFQATGAASDFFAVPAKNVIPLPVGVDYDQGAFVEPLAVAVHAVSRLGSVKGQNILVLGAGPIGNLVAQTAKGLGAAQVMITDVSTFRLDLARKCGVDFCVDPSRMDLGEELKARFGADMADGILECVGIDSTMDQAIRNARKGSDIIVVGVFGEDGKVDMGLVQDKELRLIGTLMYRKEDYITALDLLASRKVRVDGLISRHFPASDYAKAYEFIETQRDQSMKIMIDF